MSKRAITHKDIEEISDKEITICFTISGTFQAHFLGKIVARLRNRFKQYVFIPSTPFATFCFSSGDIKKIERLGDGFVLTINDPFTKKKKRKKKKSASILPEKTPQKVIDLSNPVNTSENDIEFGHVSART